LEGRQLHVALPRDVRVTAYQWQRLYAIRAGEIQIYGKNVDKSGWPGVVRAVGRACATNLVSLCRGLPPGRGR
jgi:AraC family transcriptional regulator of adaptative response/methylated-DNA-[protein]-cysteine methyltransferase